MLNIEDLVLISVDDHLIEPPDLFVNHLDAKYQDRAPKLVRNAEGSDVWTFGDAVMETAALNAVAERPKEEYGLEPQSLDEVRPGCYDVHERVKDIDAGGVLTSMNFPSFPTFTARVFASDEADLSLALVRAHDDWHIDEPMNILRWYSFEPFAHVPKERATVGALRRRTAGHDVSIMSRSTRVRTPDEKLEGFRRRARRAVAAGA